MRPTYRPNFRELIDPQLLITIGILLILGVILSMLFTDKVKDFKTQFRKKYYVYLFSSILVFALVAFVGQSETIKSLSGKLLFFQILMFLLGIGHAFIYRAYLDMFKVNDKIWLEPVFCLMIAVFGLIPFLLVYSYFNSVTYMYIMMGSMLAFLIPTLIYATFRTSVSIPAKVYKTWAFPPADFFPEPKDDEFRDMVVITFVFLKQPDSPIRTEFRAKSPMRMDFGRLFYHFVQDYNDRNPDSPIQLTDEEGNLQHWVFYLKPRWYGVSKYINPDLPMYMNGIEEDSVVICQRSTAQQENLEIQPEVEYVG